MNPFLARFIAVMLLVIPGFAATYGFLQIKNVLFAWFAGFGEDGSPALDWLRLLWGIACFSFGVAFIGGWIFYRDRKRNYLSPRFMKRR